MLGRGGNGNWTGIKDTGSEPGTGQRSLMKSDVLPGSPRLTAGKLRSSLKQFIF